MVSVGDMKNNIHILQSEAKQTKYGDDFDVDGLIKGNPQTLLPLYNYLFTSYCPQFTSEVISHLDDGLSTKSDMRFMDGVYKILRDMFTYKPTLSKEQFFTTNNFAERKIVMAIEIVRHVKNHCRYLGPKNPTNPHIKVSSVVDSYLHHPFGKLQKPSNTDQSDDHSMEKASRKIASTAAAITSLPKSVLAHKSAEKVYKRPDSMMGMNDKHWDLKAGYLRPKSAPEQPQPIVVREKEPMLEEEKVTVKSIPESKASSGSCSCSHSSCSDSSKTVSEKSSKTSLNHDPKKPKSTEMQAIEMSNNPGIVHVDESNPNPSSAINEDVRQRPSGVRSEESSDWDPNRTLESTLAKVRDLPVQLATFTRAMENKLKQMEQRLEMMEALATKAMGIAETKLMVNEEVKRDVNALRSRMVLAETKIMYLESKLESKFPLGQPGKVTMPIDTTPKNSGGHVAVEEQKETRCLVPASAPLVSHERGDPTELE